ncbi:hypothetical protein CDL15_Pgr029123 [Punica granatum]|uniref:Uncharacterized protein n=1 Tax=Punica granatum TaxID=22663 RepID=A0A218XLP0_PUNGR|nr:hypothetical protein CDL15_Pgr029123 [Punica granatum]
MEAVSGRGSKGNARRGETCGSREFATFSEISAGVCRPLDMLNFYFDISVGVLDITALDITVWQI